MECKDCPYYWADIEEYVGDDGQIHQRTVGRERCQYGYNDGYAPCEVVDEPEYDYSEDYE